MQLWKERAVIALGFYLIRGKLQLLQTSVNILYKLELLKKYSIYMKNKYIFRKLRHIVFLECITIQYKLLS